MKDCCRCYKHATKCKLNIRAILRIWDFLASTFDYSLFCFIFGLLGTDRKNRYREAIDILYSKNTFQFSDNQTFLYFHGAILPQRWNSIRTIRLEYNVQSNYVPAHPDLGGVLSSIHSLRELWVSFGPLHRSMHPELSRAVCENSWLGIVRTLREHPVTIVMEIPWREDNLQAVREKERLHNMRICLRFPTPLNRQGNGVQ